MARTAARSGAIAQALRHDIRSKIRPLAERVRLLALVDPSFQEEIKALNLEAALAQVLGSVVAADEAIVERTRQSVDSIRRKDKGGPAPLKAFRRQLRQEIAVLLEEIQLLRQLDPEAGQQMAQLGLTELVEKHKARHLAQAR